MAFNKSTAKDKALERLDKFWFVERHRFISPEEVATLFGRGLGVFRKIFRTDNPLFEKFYETMADDKIVTDEFLYYTSTDEYPFWIFPVFPNITATEILNHEPEYDHQQRMIDDPYWLFISTNPLPLTFSQEKLQLTVNASDELPNYLLEKFKVRMLEDDVPSVELYEGLGDCFSYTYAFKVFYWLRQHQRLFRHNEIIMTHSPGAGLIPLINKYVKDNFYPVKVLLSVQMAELKPLPIFAQSRNDVYHDKNKRDRILFYPVFIVPLKF